MKYSLILAITLASALGAASLGTVQIIDDVADGLEAPIERIAEQVCNGRSGNSVQISRISTISALFEHLISLPKEHKLNSCIKKFLRSIDQLNFILDDREHVCRDDKIEDLETFHHQYITKSLGSKHHEAPHLIKLFFMQYANLVSKTCSEEAVQMLTKSLGGFASQVDRYKLSKMGKEYKDLLDLDAAESSIIKFNDMQIIRAVRSSMLPEKYLKVAKFAFTGKRRITVAGRDLGSLKKIQHKCASEIKPLYSPALLATLRLIDIGYYPEATRLLFHLNNNLDARRVYELTRACEILLPIDFVESDELQVGQFSAIDKRKANQFPRDEPLEVEVKTCETCSLASTERLEKVTRDTAYYTVSKIESNLKRRKGAIHSLVGTLVTLAKHSVLSGLKPIWLQGVPSFIHSKDNRIGLEPKFEDYLRDLSELVRDISDSN